MWTARNRVLDAARGPLGSGPVWACPSCGTVSPDAARYCPACGEERLPTCEPAVARAWRRWWLTLRLLLRPGALTIAYRDGRRKPLVPPVTLFLAVNVLFFFVQSHSGITLMAKPLQERIKSMSDAAPLRQRVERRAAELAIDVERYAERFDARQVVLAKSSVVAMVPLLALSCAFVYTPLARVRRADWRREWPTHWSFALHFFAFALLFLSAFFSVLPFAFWALDSAGLNFSPFQVEAALITLMSIVMGVYVSRAGSNVHAMPLARRAGASVLVVTALFLIQALHAWVVLQITLLST